MDIHHHRVGTLSTSFRGSPDTTSQDPHLKIMIPRFQDSTFQDARSQDARFHVTRWLLRSGDVGDDVDDDVDDAHDDDDVVHDVGRWIQCMVRG